MTLPDLGKLAARKGYTLHAKALAFLLIRNTDGAKVEMDGTPQLTREQVQRFLLAIEPESGE